MVSGLVKTVLWLLAIMVISFTVGGILIATYYKDAVTKYDIETVQVNEEKTIDQGILDKLEVSAVNTEIRILPTDGSTIRAALSGTGPKNDLPALDVAESGDRLRIQVKQPRTWLGFGNSQTNPDIYLPTGTKNGNATNSQHTINDIKVETISGDITVEKTGLDKFKANAVSGDIKLSPGTFTESDLETISGDIKATGYLGEMQANTVSGSIDVQMNKLTADFDAETISGDVNLMMPQDSSFDLSYKTVSGKVTNKFPISVSSSSHEGLKGTVGKGTYSVDVQTVSGDFEVEY
jgi:lia operon protein LiaG